MIDKLKFLIDKCEGNQKLKSILLEVAALPENKQEPMLEIIKFLVQKK